MVVKQIEKVHQEIERLFESLRKGEVQLPPAPTQVITQIYHMNADTAEDLLTTLPEFVAAGTWQDEKYKTGAGTIRKVAAGQTFVKYPGAETAEIQQPKPMAAEGKPTEKPLVEKTPEPQYIVVPQAVLIIRQTKEVHREIESFLRTLLPGESFTTGQTLGGQFGPQPSGGGFF